VRIGEISKTGRATQGVKLINLEEGDRLSTVALVPEKPARDQETTSEVSEDPGLTLSP